MEGFFLSSRAAPIDTIFDARSSETALASTQFWAQFHPAGSEFSVRPPKMFLPFSNTHNIFPIFPRASIIEDPPKPEDLAQEKAHLRSFLDPRESIQSSPDISSLQTEFAGLRRIRSAV